MGRGQRATDLDINFRSGPLLVLVTCNADALVSHMSICAHCVSNTVGDVLLFSGVLSFPSEVPEAGTSYLSWKIPVKWTSWGVALLSQVFICHLDRFVLGYCIHVSRLHTALGRHCP